MSSRTLRLAFPALVIALFLPASARSAEIVKDGGFESPDNPDWAQGGVFPPICDVETCGDGGGTAGPHAGSSKWAYFSGVPTPDLQDISQEISIPPGEATLSFWLWHGRSNGGVLDSLRVLIGGDEVFEFLEGSPGYESYKQVTVDVTQHAGSGAVDLAFLFDGAGGSPFTTFSVDDISLQSGPAGTATVSLSGPKKVIQGKKAKLTVDVQPCLGHAGETVELLRGKKKVGTGAADAACITKFKVRIKRTSTFRAVSPAGTSNNLKVRIRR